MLDFWEKVNLFIETAQNCLKGPHTLDLDVFHALLNFALSGPRNWQGFSQWEHALKNTHWLILKSGLHVGWEPENLLLHCCLPWLFGMFNGAWLQSITAKLTSQWKSLALLWSWSSPAVRASTLSWSAWLCHLTGPRTPGVRLLSVSWHYCRLVDMQFGNTMGHTVRSQESTSLDFL